MNRRHGFGVAFLIVATIFASCAATTTTRAQTLDQLLAGLDDDDPDIREAASRDLLMRICNDPTIFPHLQAQANGGPSLEARVRAANIVADWIAKSPLIEALEAEAGFKVLEVLLDEFGATDVVVMFGCDFGNPDSPDVAALMDKWQMVRNAIGRADIAGAVDKTNQMRDCLEGLSDAQLAAMGFEHPDPNGTGFLDSDRDFLLAKIDAAQQILVQLGLQLYSQINPGDIVLASVSEIVGPGPVDLGTTFAATVAQVDHPGLVETLWPAASTGVFQPRAGFTVVGPALSLIAEPGLAVGGPIDITMAWGGLASQGEIGDPRLLRIARLSGTQFEYLADTRLDFAHQTLTATYAPASGGAPNGEFYLVQTPEPSTLALAGAALVVAAIVRLRSGRRRSRV